MERMLGSRFKVLVMQINHCENQLLTSLLNFTAPTSLKLGRSVKKDDQVPE